MAAAGARRFRRSARRTAVVVLVVAMTWDLVVCLARLHGTRWVRRLPEAERAAIAAAACARFCPSGV